MATGIELILAAACINATCMPSYNSKNHDFQEYYNIPNNTLIINADLVHETSFQRKERELNKVKEWLNGRTIKIATIEDYPLSYTKQENGTVIGAGVSFKLVNILAKKFNFTYEVVKPKKNIIGAPNDIPESLIQFINKTNADMAAAFIPILSNTREFLYYSTAILDEGRWHMIMVRPSETAGGSGLLAPFDTQVWILILVAMIALGPIIYILVLLRSKIRSPIRQEPYKLGHCVWFVYGSLMKQGTSLAPFAESSRMIFATWWMFITILTAFYTANLTAYLTLSIFDLPYTTAEDILDSSKHFVTLRGSGIEYSIKYPGEPLHDLNYLVRRKRATFTESINDTEILTTLVEKKKYVYFRDKPAIELLMLRSYFYRRSLHEHDIKIHCPFAIAKTPILKKRRTFAYPYNSKLSRLFDAELLSLVETGVVKHLVNENVPKVEICPKDLGGTDRQLRVGDLSMTFYVICSGYMSGIVIFFTEMLFKFINMKCTKHKQPIGHTLRGPVKNVNVLPFTTNLTPPPPYGSIFNSSGKQNRKLINVKPMYEKSGVRKFINGRDYYVYQGNDGTNTLVPVRAPSAALFQYSYTE